MQVLTFASDDKLIEAVECCNTAFGIAGSNATEYDQVHALAQRPVSKVGCLFAFRSATSIPTHLKCLVSPLLLPAGNPGCGGHSWPGGLQSWGWRYVRLLRGR